jgi:hypothetical protein
MATATSLQTFFQDLNIPESAAQKYASGLHEIGIWDEIDLRKLVNDHSLEKVGASSTEIQKIMQRLFIYTEEDRNEGQLREPSLINSFNSLSVTRSIYNKTSPYLRRLTRDAVIILEEIGHGASGCVSKAFFVPSLTFLAIKRIEIKEAAMHKIVGQELKVLYEVARSNSTGPLVAPADSDNQEPNLSLLSGQSYSDVISGKPPYPSDPIVHDSDESTPQTAESPVLSQANSPYIVGFYDAYIDPESGAVSLILEYMNGGSIQKTLDSGNTYDEDCVAVLVYSVLKALVELHSRSILHRDIKPSNILTGFDGRIKLSDFGITKGICSIFSAYKIG